MSNISEKFIRYFICGFSQHLVNQNKTDLKSIYHKIGLDLAPQLLEIHKIQQTNDLFYLLKQIKNMLSNFYTSKRTLDKTDDGIYFLAEYEPLFGKSGVKSCIPCYIIVGIIEGCLKCNMFDHVVSLVDASDQKSPSKVYYVIKDEKNKII